MANDFKPFKRIMTKVESRKMDSSYEIYMALYQQLTGEDELETFRQFKPGFFDLVIVDECHRGSAKENSRWRKVLDYFDKATHIGMTATPKETEDISSSTYFNKPVYTYSLKQGIDDGFLAPYKVIRVGLDIDLLGYRPSKGERDVYGEEIEDREYGVKDFDKNIIIDERIQVVAEKVTEFLKRTDRFSKTIVFCNDINHAERMRMALVNLNSDLVRENDKYIMRITGDNQEGKNQLDNFIDADSQYPTVVTTSELMTTGVDCKTCKLIVLDNNFGEGGMIKFKQIIGRGTRLVESRGKMYFTILDFRNASRMFADPGFDGEPIVIYEANQDDPIPENNDIPEIEMGNTDKPNDFNDEEIETRHIYRVNGIQVDVVSERVQYYDVNGKLITESLKDYTRKNILNEYKTLDDFLTKWTGEEKSSAIIEELKEQGILLDALREESGQKEIDDFDLICHIAFDKKPLTKSERIKRVKQKPYFENYSAAAQKVLNILLDKYAIDGVLDFEDISVLKLKEFHDFGSLSKIIALFNGKENYLQAVRGLRRMLYTA
jgi:type I restriction enzyme R subunit